jgi:DNA-binding PadR family transcriptional regulator
MDVKTLCLGILTFGDATGYEIKKAFQQRFSLVFDAGFGSIYPALTKLTEENMVACRAESQNNRPDKKIYSITDEGKLAFLQELKKLPAADKFRSEALATLMFSSLLQPRHVSDVVDGLIQMYDENITKLSDSCDIKQSLSEQFLCGYGVAVRKAAITYLQENRHLIEADSLMATVGDQPRLKIMNEVTR